MVDDRPSERVLSVGVHIHLHNAVVQRFADFGRVGAATAVKHQVERLGIGWQPELSRDILLSVPKDAWTEFHVARLVHTVYVSEGCGEHVATPFAGAENLGGSPHIRWCGVELLVDRADDPILLTTDDADLHFQDDLSLVAFNQESVGNLEIFLEFDRRAVPHV